MPEDSKKNQQKKGKNDAKEQRKPRQLRHQTGSNEKKHEVERKKNEEDKIPKLPIVEEPGPEFYKNLKRETDEILKITVVVNSKYKKKEIQSNWTKYEMPIESYEEIEEQENMGADYEKLIEASLSIGGHFQFKHEKSWDISTGPSLYDKYFDINMDNLALALSTIPFYKRNSIDKSIFSETDILNMKNRSTRFKQKYYNDKTYTTPELEAQDKILNILEKSSSKPEESIENNVSKNAIEMDNNIIVYPEEKTVLGTKEIEHDESKQFNKNETLDSAHGGRDSVQKELITETTTKETNNSVDSDIIDDIDDIILGNFENINKSSVNKVEIVYNKVETPENKAVSKVSDSAGAKTKNSVIESPEDLEKWLDDFLE